MNFVGEAVASVVLVCDTEMALFHFPFTSAVLSNPFSLVYCFLLLRASLLCGTCLKYQIFARFRKLKFSVGNLNFRTSLHLYRSFTSTFRSRHLQTYFVTWGKDRIKIELHSYEDIIIFSMLGNILEVLATRCASLMTHGIGLVRSGKSQFKIETSYRSRITLDNFCWSPWESYHTLGIVFQLALYYAIRLLRLLWRLCVHECLNVYCIIKS